MRLGNLDKAIEILESVVHDDGSLRIAVPTLAICYVQTGAWERGAALLKDDDLAAAEADSEMAYRLATYFAVEGDSCEALHWLRRAIYLGNENYPWFQKNPPGTTSRPTATSSSSSKISSAASAKIKKPGSASSSKSHQTGSSS